MNIQANTRIFEHPGPHAKVSVVVPVYNYAGYIEETLTSLIDQTLESLSLVVVDDCSKDDSVEVVKRWMQQHHRRFASCLLARNDKNAKLATTRNTGVSMADSDYLFFLDADNVLYPRCIARHAEALDAVAHADGAYSVIEIFDAQAGVMGGEVFSRERLKRGNYIDAMAMIRRSSFDRLGGYRHIEYGWEDFDLWLRMAEDGLMMLQVPEILSRYRVHASSMLRSHTNVNNNHLKLRKDIEQRHPWLELD